MQQGPHSRRARRFFEKLAGAQRAALVLDYDGTLTSPGRMREPSPPNEHVLDTLVDLRVNTDTRIVIVSERPIWELQQLLGEASARMELWGARGLESLRDTGTYERMAIPEASRLQLVQARLALMGVCGRSRVAIQPGCVSVHLSGLGDDERRALADEVLTTLFPFTQGPQRELSLRRFRDGVELRSRSVHKGRVVIDLLERWPDLAIAYVGDDMSDEDAFSSLGARGLRVLARSEPRPTQADIWLRDASELIRFMGMWRESRQGRILEESHSIPAASVSHLTPLEE